MMLSLIGPSFIVLREIYVSDTLSISNFIV